MNPQTVYFVRTTDKLPTLIKQHLKLQFCIAVLWTR